MIEALKVLTETAGTGIAKSTFATAYTIGAKPLSAEATDTSFGDLAFNEERSGVSVDRTPDTEDDLVAGSHVEWRGQRWRVERRAEARSRTRFDLLLSRAA